MSNDLTFEAFRQTNLSRCQRWHDGFPDEEAWTVADWTNATSGEVGELAEAVLDLLTLLASLNASSGKLANAIKKIRRTETGHKPGAKDPSVADLRALAEDEIGDVYAYLDLLATKLGTRVEDCAVRKFNRVSVREGHPERLPEETAEPAPCDGFRYIGQPLSSCDGCGRPYWEHTHDRQMRPGAGPFDPDPWVLVPITVEKAQAMRRRSEAGAL